MATAIQVVFDCTDPARLAAFWAATLGYTLQDPPDGMATWEEWLTAQGIPEDQWNNASAIIDPDGHRPRIFFQHVPEPKTVKNRVHLDVNVSGDHTDDADEGRQRITAEVERLRTLGATQIAVFEERGEYWIVMADPEGNEFCLQ
jgi:hypothetical protein